MNPWQYMAPAPRQIDEDARARAEAAPAPSPPAPDVPPLAPDAQQAPMVPPMATPTAMPPPGPQIIRTPDRKIDLQSSQQRTTDVRETDAERAATRDIATAEQAQIKAAEGARDLGVRVAGAQEQRLADEAAQKAAFEAKRAAARAEITKVLDTELAASRKRYADHKETPLFKGRPGARIMSALASGLGAAASVISKTPNYALEIVNQGIQNHISRERAEREQLLTRSKMSEQDRALALAAFDVEDQNKRAAFLDAAADQRALTLAKFGADQARVAGDEIIARLRGESAKLRQSIEAGKRTLVENAEAKNQQFVPGSTTVARSTGGAGAGAEHLVRGPGGRALFAVADKKEAAELSTVVAARQRLQGLIAAQKASFDKYGAEAMGEEAAAREARATSALQTVRKLEDMGALDKGTTDVVEKQFPSNTSRLFGRGDGAARLTQFSADIDAGLAARLDAAGVSGQEALRAISAMAGGAAPVASAAGGMPVDARAKAEIAAAIRGRDPRDPRVQQARALLRGR